MKFIHLHLHTQYSMLDGLVAIKPLTKILAHMNMPAVAITDQCNLFALVKFYRAATASEIKPIIGSDLWIQNPNDEKKPHRLLLLCQNQIGYKNLTRLISKAYLEGQHLGLPLIEKSWLTDATTQGLIALSGAREGDIGQALLSNQATYSKKILAEWNTLFPNRFYLELQRTGREHEETYIQLAVELARKTGTPVVATNDVRFLNAEDFEAHEARVCIHSGWVLDDAKRPRIYSEQQYLRSEQEMLELFSDLPEALENTVEIAKRCNLELSFGQTFLPNFPVPENMTLDDLFQQQSETGLNARLTNHSTKDKTLYASRLEMEINVIKNMGFTSYFLIVADFIRWAKSQKIFVGPGRGSGAGSLVAYALEITDLDPIKHDLLFERFLNPERVSMPDFDIDFCMEGRDRVIDYVAKKYGRDSVAQIITYGTMAARAVLRDVGRVLGFPYGFVDKVAKLIPFELGMTLEKAMIDEPLLEQRYNQEEDVKTLLDLGKKLEGVPRNVGKHAGGVVIAPSVLTDFTPLYCESDGENRVTQLDKDDVEAVGLVKFDFLGLRTLTIIDWALQTINAKREKIHEPTININLLPLDDKITFDLLKTCETTAIFQLESRGMKDLARKLQIDHFDEIVALVALFRPGPLQSGMVDDFINRKHGRASVIYPHPLLEPILKPTYGVILYQEQVMQIAQVLAGYTLGSADLLRRAMGKKKSEEMAKQRAIFVSGAENRSVNPKIANQIFDLMEKFADYGFNKSHSAAYALLTYQTAWLKAHYPAEYMAAVLSSDMDHTDKVVRFIEDCQKFKITITPPDINHSYYKFTVNDKREIVYGLGSIKGVGSAAVESILETREKQGPFSDLFNFCQRVDTRKTNRKVLEALIRSGAMDCFQTTRASLMASLEIALQAAEQRSRAKTAGQIDLFGDEFFEASQTHIQYISASNWSEEERLSGEKETLGWYLSGHPIARYEAELSQFITTNIRELKPGKDKKVIVAGYVTGIRVVQTKSGNRIAFLTLDDRTARIDLSVFTELYESARELLVKDQLLIVEGEVSIDDYTDQNKLIGRQIYSLNQAREKFAKGLSLRVKEKTLDPDFFQKLKKTLDPFLGGTCPIFITYTKETAAARLTLGNEWRVRPSEKLLEVLKELCGEEDLFLTY